MASLTLLDNINSPQMISHTIVAFVFALLSLSVVSARSAGSYTRCIRTGRRTGMAHYRGWKVVGDDTVETSTVKSERECIQACSKYGNGCSGVSYSKTHSLCYLKGDDHDQWKYKRSMNREDGVDLIGGCAAWSGIVPADMDASCCRG